MKQRLRRLTTALLVMLLCFMSAMPSAFAEDGLDVNDAQSMQTVQEAEDPTKTPEESLQENQEMISEENVESVETPAQDQDGQTDQEQSPQVSQQTSLETSEEVKASEEAQPTEETSEAEDQLIPIYRLYNPFNYEHLYTDSAEERDNLYQNHNWGDEGVAWYASTKGQPVYRLYHGGIGKHLYTTDTNEVSVLSKSGWSVDNNGNPVFMSNGPVGIYRTYHRGSQVHHLTTDTQEYESITKGGWQGEGVKIYAAKAGTPTDAKYKDPYVTAKAIPVYRVYNPTTGEHLYTTGANERDHLYNKAGWGDEGVAWYAPDFGTPVYRLYNPGLNIHLYTTDKNEVQVLTSKHGWKKDNSGNPVFYSGGNTPIYRLYNANLKGLHHWTTNHGEYQELKKHGWSQEGAQLSAIKVGSPTQTKYKIERNGFVFDPPSPDCICISIDAQSMALFKNNKAVVVTPIVSGMLGIDDTRRGDHKIIQKTRNFRTVGPGFDAVCDYWLTLYRGPIWGFDKKAVITGPVGIHDAPWRSTYGGQIYRTNGSHGCVNTPYMAMKLIYNAAYVGMPVYIR